MFKLMPFLVSIVMIINNMCATTPPVIGKPWHQNTREHLFGFTDCRDTIHCSLEDEGFRWRNSFNFTVNGNTIELTHWWFNKMFRYVPDSKGGYFSNLEANGQNINFLPGASANNIHQHLSEIAWHVKTLNEAIVATTAAITLVIEHEGLFYGFSKTLGQKNGIYTSLNGKSIAKQRNLLNIDIGANTIRDNLTAFNPNLPFPGKINPDKDQYISYRCAEGKMLSELIKNGFLLFKFHINPLLRKAQQQLRNIDYQSIHTIILHLHTTMDPCAICTRCLVGLSKYLNEEENIRLLTPVEDGKILNANFFIEVSSNERYQGSSPASIGSFTGYCERSSHAECGGHDNQERTIVNLQAKETPLFLPPDDFSLVLPGGMKPWRLNHSFPPYIVFGQVNIDRQQVSPAPNPPTEHRHNAKILPPIR